MKINCRRESLTGALAAACKVIQPRPSTPVLSGCLIYTDENGLVIQSTDLEVSLTLWIPALVEEEGCVVVPARYLYDLLRRIPNEELSLSWNEESRVLEVIYGSSLSRLHTWAAEDFPPLQARAEGQELNFPAARWKRCVGKTLFVVSQQEAAFNYSGVYFRFFDEEIHVAATDSYRLALLRIPNESPVKGASVLIPGRSLGESARLAGEGENLIVSWDDQAISFSGANFLLTTRLIDSGFPDYERVIPSDPLLKVQVERERLLDTLERASLFVSPREHYAVACLRIEGDTLTVTAQAAEVGSLKEDLPLEEGAGGSCEASFNASYLLSPLQVMEQEKVSLSLNGPSGPAVYQEEGDDGSYLHLISPVCRVG